MKSVRLHLFFKSRDYRKVFLLYVIKSIISWVKKPFIYIKAVYDTIKLHIDFPNSWDRYVKLKEIEHSTELEQRKQAKAIAYTHFIGAIFRFDICLLSYCSYSSRNDVTKDNYETLYAQFDETREELKTYVKELEEMDVVIPYELKTIVEATNVDRFTDFDEYKNFSANLNTICDTINVT